MKKRHLFLIIILFLFLLVYVFKPDTVSITGMITGHTISDIKQQTPGLNINVSTVNNLNYTDSLIINITEVEINLSINDTGDCMFDFTANDYEDMTLPCTNTNNFVKECSFEAQTDGLLDIFIACNDTVGNNHSAEENRQITIDIQQELTSPSPSIAVYTFDDDPISEYETEKINHLITLQVKPSYSQCRISTIKQSYENIPGIGECIPGEYLTTCSFDEEDNQEFDYETPNREYALFVACQDGDDHNLLIINYTIDIPIPDTFPPTIESVGIGTLDNESAEIKWKTDENSNSTVIYGYINSTHLNHTETKDDNSISHSVILKKLQPLKKYYYNVTSCDPKRNCETKGPYSFTTKKTPVDTTPPVLLNYSMKSVINVSTTISWITDEQSKCHFYYGLNRSKLNKKIEQSTLTKLYNLTLTKNLFNIKDVYYYKITCYDSLNNSGSTKIKNLSLSEQACSSNFVCKEWSACTLGIQIRNCTDKNNCASDKKQEQLCLESSDENQDQFSGSQDSNLDTDTDFSDTSFSDMSDSNKGSKTGLILFIFFFVLIFGGLGGSYYFYKQGKLPQLKSLFQPIDDMLAKSGLLKPPAPGISSKSNISNIDPLRSYIEQMRKAGYSKDQIYHNLLKYGYRPDQIHKYF